MRVLTVRQPWAWAIIHGGKDVENRSRNIAGDYRGPLAIHAGAHFNATEIHTALEQFPPLNPESRERLIAIGALPRLGGDPLHVGAIIGVVDLTGVHHDSDSMVCIDTDHGLTDDGHYLSCSEWAEADAHHLVLNNPRALATLIPHKGGLGLRKVDSELEARIWAEVA